jgi:hypothetical protein
MQYVINLGRTYLRPFFAGFFFGAAANAALRLSSGITSIRPNH